MNQTRNQSTAKTRPLPPVLQSVKHDTRLLLAERINALFQSADDALFEMADRASSDTDQNLYFDSMRIVRLQRASIAQKFVDNYSRNWGQILSVSAPITQQPAVELQAEDFSLVQNDELEISVAAAGISSKVTSMFLLPITQLTKRIESVCDKTIEPQRNPLGPQSLSQAFIQGIETLDVNIKVRIILLKLFERFVAEQLEAVYQRANDILIDAGVLPQLKQRAQKSQSHPTNGASSPVRVAEVEPSQPPEQHDSFAQLQNLLSAARQRSTSAPLQGVPGGQPHSADTAQSAQPPGQSSAQPPAQSSAQPPAQSAEPNEATLISTPQLLEVLGVVQGSTSSEPIDLEQPIQPLDLQQLIQSTTASLQDLDGKEGAAGTSKALEPDSADVVDLVRMLFDYILNDRNLAIPMKALIGRLQIPILKVALLDNSFFAQTSHPARQLLNELSSAGIGWSTANELKRDETYNKIESIVLRVMNGFSEDLNLFSNLIAELRHFVNKEKKKRNHVEQRVKETEQGKARTTQAKQTVQNLINQKACGLRLPSDSGHFVSDAWSKVLVYIFITQGHESQAWLDAAATLDDLLWVLQPLTDEHDIARREDRIPELITELEAGITLANLSEATDQMARLVETIEEIHRADLAFIDEANNISLPKLAVAEQPELILVSERSQPQPIEEAPAELLAEVDAINEGRWVELREDSNNLIRCKLATIVQPGNRYVFVNRKGMKVCERTRHALAFALDAGELQLLDDTEMFDRALEAVIGNLRNLQDNPSPIE